MASGLRKRTYTRAEVIDAIYQDSDSEGNHFEDDSSGVSSESDNDSNAQSGQETDKSGSDADSDTDPSSPRGRQRRGQGLPRGLGRVQRGQNIPSRNRARAGTPGRRAHRAQINRPRRGRIANRRGRDNGNQQNGNGQVQGQGGAFQWVPYDIVDPFTNDWLPEYRQRRGVLLDASDFKEVDYFKLFFPDSAFELIARETNNYAMSYLDSPVDLPPHSRFSNWVETDPNEIKAYTALQIAMGLCQKNEITDYWGKFWLSAIPFWDVMSRNRFQLLTSFLHFADNSADRPERGQPGYDPLWKVRPLLNLCEEKYTTVYTPTCELSIDESIIKFKGRVHFRQYLPSKPYRWGIKQYALCESKSGYALKFITYCGKGSLEIEPGFSVTESICLSLLNGFENRGHKVFTDNYYTSPVLYRELERRGIGACGTVKPGQKFMPLDLHPYRLLLAKGDDPVFMRCDNLVSCAWHDTKGVHFLSTMDTNNTVDKRMRSRGAEGGHRMVEKPVMAELYNQHMGGVDIMDQRLGTYAFPHKNSKWYSAIYHRLREVALINGYTVYAQSNPDASSPRAFREKVIDGLLEGYEKRKSRQGRPTKVEQPLRLTERHFVGQQEDPKFKPECAVCSSRTKPGWKRKQTSFVCKQCNLSMCSVPCHEIYHTYQDFQSAAARIVYNL